MSALPKQDAGQKVAFLLGLLMLIKEYLSFIVKGALLSPEQSNKWATALMKHSSLFQNIEIRSVHDDLSMPALRTAIQELTWALLERGCVIQWLMQSSVHSPLLIWVGDNKWAAYKSNLIVCPWDQVNMKNMFETQYSLI